MSVKPETDGGPMVRAELLHSSDAASGPGAAARQDRTAASPLRRLVTPGVVSTVALGIVPTASAHGESAHAGVPHWWLLLVLLLGLGVLVGGIYLGRNRWTARPRVTVVVVLLGAVLVVVASIGLSELQVDPVGTDATPIPRAWYPLLAGVVGVGFLSGSLVLGLRRWSRRPRYPTLGALFGLWAAYPALVPGPYNYWNPLGYGLVFAVPLVVGYLLWRDVRPALAEATRFERRIGWAVGGLFAVFLLFSTGQFTFNPDSGVGLPDESFIVTEFANPLVMWPAVELYVPSVPLFAALSVGTVVTFGLLAGLTGTNAVLATIIWRLDVPMTRSRGVLGGLTTTGATACCCCAPAVYSIAGAVVGASASPLYWVFTDPASPLGDLFFVGAAALMTGSAVQLAATLGEAGVCEV